VESTSGPYEKGKYRFPDALYKAKELWEHHQSITRRQSNKISQLAKNKSTTISKVVFSSAVGSLLAARLLSRDVRDWDIRNLRIETQIAEVQRASHG